MGKRNQRADPNDPMQWLGQPYTPHDPYYYVTGPGRLRTPLKGLGMYGCIFLIVAALTVGALIAVGFAQTYGPGFWALLGLIGVAIIGTLAAVVSVRRRSQTKEQQRHHHHHKNH